MIKELSTMALAAVLTTNISANFDTVFSAAKDMSGIYQIAGTASSPNDFMSRIVAPKSRLEAMSAQVATMATNEIGPFGVMVIATK